MGTRSLKSGADMKRIEALSLNQENAPLHETPSQIQHKTKSIDCEQSLFGQSRLSSAGLERALRTRTFLARVNSLSPVLPSLDVTDRRGTARSLLNLLSSRSLS